MRAATAIFFVLLTVAGCAGAVTGPPGQISSTDRNPETGSRGGTGSGAAGSSK